MPGHIRGTPIKDVTLPDNAPKTLLLQKHTDYIAAYGEKKDDYEYIMTEYLRMNGMYWGLTAMALGGQLERMDRDEVISFVKACQTECRPEKLPDVCYSWWVLASMAVIGRLHWIDKEKLKAFMLACQDDETGGFADRPGDMVDPFHTLFGLAGLSLLGDPAVQPVNPVYCMPEDVIRRLGLSIYEDDS
nr:hypothetical protein BaRGS_030672 [Batillaria attramentaria]